MIKKTKLWTFFIVALAGAAALLVMFARDIKAAGDNSQVPTVEGAEYVGMETCSACHEEIVKRYRLESHYGTSLEEGEKIVGEACESCHGAGSLHVDGGDKSKIVRYSAEKCFSCHTDKKVQFQLQYHHPVPEGQMACTDCHDIHNTDKVVHSVATSLERQDETCFKCHKELKGPFVFEHDAMREGCQICHEPHGGVYNKLLVADDDALCLRCHWEAATNAGGAGFGGVQHGRRTGAGAYFIGAGEECVDHHRAPHGSNFWRTFNR